MGGVTVGGGGGVGVIEPEDPELQTATHNLFLRQDPSVVRDIC